MAQLSASSSGPRPSGFFSQAENKAATASSECESGVGDTESTSGNANGSTPAERPSGSTLSIDFNNPLVGAQRVETIQQMIKTHPAFRTAQQLQEFIFKTQTSLRRTPGVAPSVSKEVSDNLQDIGCLVSREYAGLLEQYARLALDYAETEKGASRLSRDAIENKRNLENMSAKFDNIYGNYSDERERRERYENDIRGITEYLTGLATQLRAVKHKVLGGCEANTHSELVNDLEGVISGLDDKVGASPCSWSSGKTPRSSNALIRTAEHNAPMSPANKDAVTNHLKALGLFDGDAGTKPSNGMTSTIVDLPRTPVNSRSVVPPIDRTPTRNNISPLRYVASPGPGHHYNRSRGSNWSMSNNNGFANGPRSRTASISANAFQPPHSFNGGMPSRRGGFFGGGQGSRFGFPNIELPQTSVFSPPMRPGTAFEPNRDARNGAPNLAVGFGRGSGPNNTQDPFQGTNGVFPSRDGTYALNAASGSSQSTSAAQLTNRAVQKWQKQIRSFYKALHSWVERFASQERPANDAIMNSGVWPVLLKSYRPLSAAEATSYLDVHLKENLPRYCLVTRVIVDYVVNLIWMTGGWKGADEVSTLALQELEKDMKQSEGLPAYQRKPLLDRQADIIESILRRLPDFVPRRIKAATGSILNNLGPLLARNYNAPEAFAQLRAVLQQAYDISSAMLTARVSFDYRFPLIGSRFTSQSMVNVWPADMDPLELQAKHWRVALVTTPVITCRSDNGSDISAHAVSQADVFCMQ